MRRVLRVRGRGRGGLLEKLNNGRSEGELSAVGEMKLEMGYALMGIERRSVYDD